VETSGPREVVAEMFYRKTGRDWNKNWAITIVQLVLGQIFTIPAGTSLQVDGSYHVQTSRRQKNPCNPNPCFKVKKSVCEVVGPTTAKCSRKLLGIC